MADDSFKDMLMRLKNRSSIDPDKTDIMNTREILGEDLAQQEAEKMFGKTEAKADFQDRIKKERAARGMDMLEKARERSKNVRWLPDTSDDVTKEVKRSALKKMGSKAGSGLLRRAAGVAIGGPLMLASELADASEMGVSEDDKMLESTEYTPEQKEALKRGIAMKRKLLSESGDVSQDPAVLRAKEVGERLEAEHDAKLSPEQRKEEAMDTMMRKVSPEEQMKIIRQLRDANRRK